MRPALAFFAFCLIGCNCFAQNEFSPSQKTRIEQIVRSHFTNCTIESIETRFADKVDVSECGGPSSPRRVIDPRCPSGFFEKSFCIDVHDRSLEMYNGRPVSIQDHYLYFIEPSGQIAYEDFHYSGVGYHNLSLGLRPVEGWLKEIYNCLPEDFRRPPQKSNEGSKSEAKN